jgi:glycosyltransferase involved in cell wall biosynthesis
LTRPASELGVLQLVDNLDIGGAQEVVATLAKHLAGAGHRPVIATFRDGPLRSYFEELGIPVVFLPRRRHSVLALPLFVRDMVRIRQELTTTIARYDIDVVQTHLVRSLDFLTTTLRSKDGLPLVYWTFHNSDFTLRREHLSRHGWLLKPKQIVYRFLYRLTSRRVSGVVAVSDDVRTSILDRIGPLDDKIVVIANGVDVDRYGDSIERDEVRAEIGLDPNAFVMVMVATFKKQKGHVYLIDAAAEVLPHHPEARILLIGDGELRPEMERRVRSVHIADAVRFLGSRHDVARILAASDIFVLPSLWEGLPMALLEAMASGLPCIATTVSGTKQVIVPEVTGLLVPPGNTFALRDAMVTMLTAPERARPMGAAGRRRVSSEFSAHKQAADLIARFTVDFEAIR